MSEMLYNRDAVIAQAKKITIFCNKLPCYSVNVFCETNKFNKEVQLPKNGVYVVFEEGETAFGQKRIVRVGTHLKNDNLVERLANHFRHSSFESSIFRKLVGSAMDLNEAETTEYMKSKMSFSVIEVPAEEKEDEDKYIRLRLEEKIIATLSWCAFFKGGTEPSGNWAGKELCKKNPCNSTYQQISEFGLWLSDGLLKPPVTSDEDEIYKYLK